MPRPILVHLGSTIVFRCAGERCSRSWARVRFWLTAIFSAMFSVIPAAMALWDAVFPSLSTWLMKFCWIWMEEQFWARLESLLSRQRMEAPKRFLMSLTMTCTRERRSSMLEGWLRASESRVEGVRSMKSGSRGQMSPTQMGTLIIACPDALLTQRIQTPVSFRLMFRLAVDPALTQRLLLLPSMQRQMNWLLGDSRITLFSSWLSTGPDKTTLSPWLTLRGIGWNVFSGVVCAKL